MSSSFTRRRLWLATIPALAMSTHSRAEPADIAGYSAEVNGEIDDANFHKLQGLFTLPFGQTGWAQVAFGSTTSTQDADDVDVTTAGASAGFSTGAIDWQASYAHRENGSSFKQQDISASATYIADRGSVGLDLFYRAADYETIASIERRFRDPLAVSITSDTKGRGAGVHGDVNVTEQLSLSSGVMVYDYDDTADLPTRLGRLDRVSLSGVTREEAYLKDSVNVGATYHFAVMSLSATYYRDREVESELVTNTAELHADIPLTERWALAAWVGHAMTDDQAGLTYGGAKLSVTW